MVNQVTIEVMAKINNSYEFKAKYLKVILC